MPLQATRPSRVTLLTGLARAYLCAMPDRKSETERIRLLYDRNAGRGSSAPPSGNGAVRWLCSQAEGDTLEIGIGRGRTLPFYPGHVRLTAIELSGASLAIAARRALSPYFVAQTWPATQPLEMALCSPRMCVVSRPFTRSRLSRFCHRPPPPSLERWADRGKADSIANYGSTFGTARLRE